MLIHVPRRGSWSSWSAHATLQLDSRAPNSGHAGQVSNPSTRWYWWGPMPQPGCCGIHSGWVVLRSISTKAPSGGSAMGTSVGLGTRVAASQHMCLKDVERPHLNPRPEPVAAPVGRARPTWTQRPPRTVIGGPPGECSTQGPRWCPHWLPVQLPARALPRARVRR